MTSIRREVVVARRAVSSLAMLCLGCSSEELVNPGLLEVTNETEWALVASAFGEPVCRGDELFIDRQLERLQNELGVALENKVPVNVHAGYPVPGCNSGGIGCYRNGVVNTRWEALPHELVHVVAAPVGAPVDFWREGLAEAVSGGRTERGYELVVDSVDKDNLEFSYLTAGHFVRWLIESRGMGTFLDLYRGMAFDAVYGESLAGIEEEFNADAPWSYPPLESCDLPGLELASDAAYDDTVEIDCDDPSGSHFDGFVPRVSTARAFEVAEAGAYDLDVTGGLGVFIYKCQTSVILEDPGERTAGDVFSEIKVGPWMLLWGSGQRHTIALEAGKHRMTIVAREGHLTDTVRVVLAPAQ